MASEGPFDPLAILRSLNAAAVDYVVIGGFAVAAYGVIRATEDLDLVVEAEWENAGRLARALRSIAARDLDDSLAGISQESLVRRVDRRVRTQHGDAHLLHAVPGVPRYSELLPATILQVGSERVPVASLERLTEMKRAAGRPKDAVDLAELEALGPPGSMS